jgi:hypothetical protein
MSQITKRVKLTEVNYNPAPNENAELTIASRVMGLSYLRNAQRVPAKNEGWKLW